MTCSFATNNDYENHWAENEIDKFHRNKFIELEEDGFNPNKSMTRGEFIRLVNNVYGFNERTDDLFSDMELTDKYFNDALIARNIGYISGYPDNTFKPKRNITREEAAKVFYIIMNLEESKLNSLKYFKDYEKISEWSNKYLNRIVEKKYLNGYLDKTLRPKNNITRAESVKMIDNIIGTIVKTSDEVKETKIINGNLIVIESDINLKNYDIKGDLIVTAAIGEGNFTLEDSNIDGDSLILGGGTESINIINSTLNRIIIDKNNDSIRLFVDVNSLLNNLDIKSGAIIHSESENIKELEINSFEKKINLLGSFKSILINKKNEIQLDIGTTIKNLVLNDIVNIYGKGNIIKVIVNFTGSNIGADTKEIQLNNDSEIILNGDKIVKNYIKEDSTFPDNNSNSNGSSTSNIFKFLIKDTFIGSPTFDLKVKLGTDYITGYELLYNSTNIASDSDNDGIIRTLNHYRNLNQLVIKYNDKLYKNNSVLNKTDQITNSTVDFFTKISFEDAPTFDLKASLNGSYIQGYDLLYDDLIVASDNDYDGIVRTINLYQDIDKLRIAHEDNVYIDTDNIFSDLN
jgi:hypothetical protein